MISYCNQIRRRDTIQSKLTSPDLQSASPSPRPVAIPAARRHAATNISAESFYPKFTVVFPHEPLECYVPGGFHPVSLGDTFKDGRYTIRHKLGYGGQSTVWLAWDGHAHGPGAWVSIKIKSARGSVNGLGQDSEISILKKLEKYYCSSEMKAQTQAQNQAQSQTQTRFFIRLLDTFQHTGPNGVHNCIVTEVLGPTLADVLDDYRYRPDEITLTLPPDVVLRVSRQLLQGLDFAHHAGIAHGDVSPQNIAFTFKSAYDDNLFEMAGGEPPTAAYDNHATRAAGLPERLVACTAWDGWYFDPIEDIRLIDWGWSFSVEDTVTVLGQPNNLRPAETFFGHSFTYKHDLWRAGCVIYALFYQKPPFDCIVDPDHFFIRRLVAKLGPLPAPWHAKWEEMLVGYKSAEKDGTFSLLNSILSFFFSSIAMLTIRFSKQQP